jgi:Ca2+-binding RTX toxin-like protein
MLDRMFTYLGSRSVRRVRAVAVITSGALFAGLMVTVGAGPTVAQAIDQTVFCGMCLTEPSALAVSVTGSSKITVNGGGVYTNSNGAPAVSVTGSSKIVTNAQVRAVGTIVKTGSSTISGTPAAGLSGPLFADPYPGRELVVSVGPNNATTDYNQSNGSRIPARVDGEYRDVSLTGSGTFSFPEAHRYRDVTVGGSVTATLKPGRYRNITLGGSSKVTLMPGSYWLAGSLNVAGSSKVTGTDASLVLACGTAENDTRACVNEVGGRLTLAGISTLTLNGNTPTSPAVSFVPGNNSDMSVSGSAKLVLANSGIDAPNAPIVATGSASITTAGVIHARRVNVTGSSTITATVIPTPPPTTTTTSTTTTTLAPSTNDLDVSNDAGLLCQLATSIVGTVGPDVLVGTPGADVICGLDGNDQIDGLGGDDLVFGGPGNDALVGGDGTDSLYGENGDDTLLGQGEVDALVGGQGNDQLHGGNGNDVLHGELGDDNLEGDEDEDRIFGGGGADTATGGDGNDLIVGEEGVDTANGAEGLDVCKTSENAISCEGPRPFSPPGLLNVSVGSAALQVGSPGGILVSDLVIETLPVVPALSGWQIGDAYEITNRSGVKPQTISLTISVPAIGPLDEYSIVTLDELTGVWVEASLNQIRDVAANTITVQLEHFSPYAVVRKKVAAKQPPKSLRCIGSDFGRDVEVDLLVDSSGSLDEADSADLRTEAILRVLETLPSGSTLRIVEFDRTPRQIFAGTLNALKLACEVLCDDGTQAGLNAMQEISPQSLYDDTLELAKKALVAPGTVPEFSVIVQNGRRVAYEVNSEFDPNFVHDGIVNIERVISGQAPYSKVSGLPLQIERSGDDLVVFGAEGIPLGLSSNRRFFRKVLPPTHRPKNLTDQNWRSLQNLQPTQSIWRLQPRAVGIAFEESVCQEFQIIPANQKALDCFDEGTGLATSVKTFNFHRTTYRNSVKKGSDTLNKYLGQLANYKRTQTGPNYIDHGLILAKTLHIGIPPGLMSVEYQAVFTQLRARAATLNISIVIEPIA